MYYSFCCRVRHRGPIAVVWILVYDAALWPLLLLVSLWWIWTTARIAGIGEIRALPAEMAYTPAEGEMLLDKKGTKLVISYQ